MTLHDKEKKTRSARGTVRLTVLVLLIFAILTMPLAVSKYEAVGEGNAKARVAAFDIAAVPVPSSGHTLGFDNKTEIFYHRGNYSWRSAAWTNGPNNLAAYAFGIDVTNNSEVAVRVELKLYNVYTNTTTNSSIAAGSFNWTNSAYRAVLPPVSKGTKPDDLPTYWDNPGVTDFAGWTPTDPLGQPNQTMDFVRHHISAIPEAVGDACSAGTWNGLAHWLDQSVTLPTADSRYYYNDYEKDGSGNLLHPIGSLLKPGESVRLRICFAGGNNAANLGNLIESNSSGVQLGTRERAYRINYDILATQVD